MGHKPNIGGKHILPPYFFTGGHGQSIYPYPGPFQFAFESLCLYATLEFN